jgi:thioredoxin-dependent peroxiredoxin
MIYCAKNEYGMYADTTGWRTLPSHIPSGLFKTRVRDERVGGDNPYRWEDVSTWDIFASRRVLVFSLPGAFTPTCDTMQLPTFERLANKFYEKEIDAIYCISVNDAFVMNKWAESQNLQSVSVLPDGNGIFTEGMEMLVEKENLGFGKRSWRYAAVVDNGRITDWFIEEGKEDNCKDDPYVYTCPHFILSKLS